jgi:single-strand DNA-binding protein
MSFEIVGKMYKKFAAESKSPTFQAREFVVEVADGNYPQMIKFQLLQERCQLLDGYNEGEEVKVHFDLRGREWQGKFFTTLNCWRIEKSDGTSAQPVQQVATATTAAKPKAASSFSAPPSTDDAFPSLKDEPLKATADDDLPF